METDLFILKTMIVVVLEHEDRIFKNMKQNKT